MRIPMRLKGKFSRSIVRLTMLNSSKCWAVDRRIKQNMSVAEMKMLRWMNGVSREDRIRDDYVRGSISMTSILEKMR
jgi:hypothetical protein